MKIDVYFRHNDVNPDDLHNSHVIVIDVLRATSVIVTALNNGAKLVQTVAKIEQAFEIKRNNPSALLAGERDAVKIQGFDFGNSPLEMTRENIGDTDLVMCTSNGTQAVAVAVQAKSIRAAAFVNMEAVVRDLLRLKEDFIIICSGTNGNFSLDDGLAAGMLINRIKQEQEVQAIDSGLAMALGVSGDHILLEESLKDCYHLNLLQKRGFQNDVDYCLSIDIIDVVPKYVNGKFIL